MSQKLVDRIEDLEENIKDLQAQLQEKKVVRKQLYYEKSALADYGISETTARRHIKNGVLNGYRFGKKIYVKIDELEQKIEEGKIPGGKVRA